jgi:putative component of membrane protein insertase Oxa1/YidC/SpoIIIJ protein YidD
MFRSIVVLLLVSSAILFGGKEISYAKETTVSALSQREVSFEEDSEVLPYPPHRFMTLGAIRTYQLLIAPSKGSECPMHPHCSLYGQMAFGRFNPMQAFIMTADRLHRCGHDLMNYDSVEVNDSVKFYDSLPDSKPKEVSLSFLEPTK